MKTPMQEMFDQLKASKKDEYGLAFAIDMLLENEKTMLEKEKDTMKSCIIMGFEFIPVDPNRYNEDAELLYNETFNTKEK